MSRNNNYESNGGSKIWLLGLAAVVAVGFFAFRQHGKPEGAAAPTSASELPGSAPNPALKPDRFGVIPGYHSVPDESRFLVDIPWNEFRLANDGALRIEMEPRKWCTMGDLDVIAFDGRLADNPRFLLTLEPLNPEDASFKPLVRQLTTADLKNGFRYAFKLPPMKKGMQAGIFLCKDSSSTGRCNTEEREVIDLNRAMADNAEKGAANKGYHPPDRIYFFQYLYLSADNQVATFMNPEVPDITFDAVSERLKKSDASKEELALAQRALGRAKKLQQTLRSLPLEQGPGVARIVLPQLDGDEKRCPKVAKVQPPGGGMSPK